MMKSRVVFLLVSLVVWLSIMFVGFLAPPP